MAGIAAEGNSSPSEALGTNPIITTARISLNALSVFFRELTDAATESRELYWTQGILNSHLPSIIRVNPWPDLYLAKLFTNSTRLRNAIPDGPFAIHGF